MHKIAESPMNTGFLRLYIYTFRYFEKEKQKINSLKISGFQCGKPTYSAKRFICFAVYFDFVKVIFWLSPKLYFGLQPKLR